MRRPWYSHRRARRQPMGLRDTPARTAARQTRQRHRVKAPLGRDWCYRRVPWWVRVGFRDNPAPRLLRSGLPAHGRG